MARLFDPESGVSMRLVDEYRPSDATDRVMPCRQCGTVIEVSRCPTDDQKSFIRTLRCDCSIVSYREDYAVKVSD